MNSEQIKYLVTVAESGSISISAEKLHVTQAAISKSISNIEKDLGIKLFKRSRSGTQPTEEGKKIIQKAITIMEIWQEIKEEANLQKSIVDQKLKLAGTQGLFISILPKALANFKKDYPHVHIDIAEKGTYDIVKSVKENNIDIGLSILRESLWYEEGIQLDVLYQGKMKVIVSKHSSLANKKWLTPKDLLRSSFVVYNGFHSKAFFQNFIQQYGDINIIFSTSNSEVIRRTVSENLAITFSYDISLKRDPYIMNGDIVAIPLIDHHPIDFSFGLVLSQHVPLSTAAKEFIKYLRIQASQY